MRPQMMHAGMTSENTKSFL